MKIYEKIYKLHLHCGIGFYKRWFWRKYLEKGDVNTLEVGPGGGPWTLYLLELGNRVTVLDVDEDSLNRLEYKLKRFGYCKPSRIRLVHSHIRDFDPNEYFDQIVLFEVLEHIKEDKFVMQKLAKYLRPGGRILISTPSADHIPLYSDGGIDTEGKGGHVRKGYSLEDFEQMACETGLEVIFKDSRYGYFTQWAMDVERATPYYLSNRVFKMFLNALLRPFTWLDIFYAGYPKYTNFVILTQPRQKI